MPAIHFRFCILNILERKECKFRARFIKNG